MPLQQQILLKQREGNTNLNLFIPLINLNISYLCMHGFIITTIYGCIRHVINIRRCTTIQELKNNKKDLPIFFNTSKIMIRTPIIS